MTEPPAAVLLDADGVIQTARPGWKENLAALVSRDEGEAFLADLFEAEQAPLRGEGNFPDEVATVLAAWGSTAEPGAALANWLRIDVYEDVLDVVRDVRRAGTPCHLATNQQAFRAAYMRAELGYDAVFDDEFYSCDLGLVKPDPAYFATIVERIGEPAGAVLFVDDNEPNVAGARRAGLRAEHFPPHSGAEALRAMLHRHGVPLGRQNGS